MSESVISIPRGKKAKKEIRKTIQEKLTVTLADYKTVLGDKKFESRIRKTARLIGAEILRSLPKKQKKTSKTPATEI